MGRSPADDRYPPLHSPKHDRYTPADEFVEANRKLLGLPKKRKPGSKSVANVYALNTRHAPLIKGSSPNSSPKGPDESAAARGAGAEWV